MRCGKMKVAIVAGFPAKGYVNVDACHIIKLSHKENGSRR
jgi:hypothetical protein